MGVGGQDPPGGCVPLPHFRNKLLVGAPLWPRLSGISSHKQQNGVQIVLRAPTTDKWRAVAPVALDLTTSNVFFVMSSATSWVSSAHDS